MHQIGQDLIFAFLFREMSFLPCRMRIRMGNRRGIRIGIRIACRRYIFLSYGESPSDLQQIVRRFAREIVYV
jgi:hypothetical protein